MVYRSWQLCRIKAEPMLRLWRFKMQISSGLHSIKTMKRISRPEKKDIFEITTQKYVGYIHLQAD